MILKEFNKGWSNKFNTRLENLFKYFPDIELESAERYKGMLRVRFKALDNEVQDIVDSVAYKIERESARTCEFCGEYGRRKEEFLPEKMCVCWKCHALHGSGQIETQEKE